MNLFDMAREIEGEANLNPHGFDEVDQQKEAINDGFQLTTPEPKDMTGRLKTAKDAMTYMLAGNAYITLRSAKTSTRYTYRITRAKNALDETGVHFVKVLTGPENENNYSYFGYIKNKEYYPGGSKAKIGNDAPSVVAFKWAFDKLMQDAELSHLEVWHDGRCGRCGRKLTVPESVERGIGPECAVIMGI